MLEWKASKSFVGTCESCGGSKASRPLWIGKIHDEGMLGEPLNPCIEHFSKEGEKIARLALEEVDMPPAYFVPDKIADELGLPSRSLERLIKALKNSGFRATRTAINPGE